jgi:hypothetical protein
MYQDQMLKYYDICQCKMLTLMQYMICNAVAKSYRCWEDAVYWLLATKVFVNVLIIRLNTTYRSSTLVLIKQCDIFRLS